jgi:hypothetical protein
MRAGTLLLSLGCSALGGVLGCQVGDIVVARDLPPDGGVARFCVAPGDCYPDELCERPSCGAAQGQCELRPDVCDGTEQLVCGCDGVTYWNDCLRQRDGVPSGSPGQCTQSYAPCAGPGPGGCPAPDAVCGHLLAGESGPCSSPDVPGVCWVLPDQCPGDAGGPLWQPCEPSAGKCLDLCSALQSEAPATRVTSSTCP